jgi:hypothetical protein
MRRRGLLVALGAAATIVFGVAIAQAVVLPSGGGSGAIFTTTPDGSIVNENVRYEGRQEVYLDGGPKQNAPSTAAGLDEGFYVFQVTDPSGKILLSRDPARCRIVHVNAAGVIDALMAPMDNAVQDPDGNTVVFYTGAATNNWEDPGPGNQPYEDEACHMPGPLPDSAAGTYAPTPDITGVGRHDTNPDVDHNDVGAIVAQLMPYGLTPNPGGVYKAWMTPIQAYVDVKGADLDAVPSKLSAGKQKPHTCYDFCAAADPGFVPSNRYTKTDNFKVTEKFPAEIKVRKFHDLNGDGIWQMATEPEIGVDQCVFEDGDLEEPCDEGGGWPYEFTEPLNGGTKTDTFYTPFTHVAAVAGTYSAEEWYLDGWVQTASWLDGSYQDPFKKKVDVVVAAITPGETHEIRFGNFREVSVTACKYEDYDGDGGKDAPIEGWEVHLTIDDSIVDTQYTGADGCYTWDELGPLPAGSYYDASETVPSGWTATSPTEVDFESPPQSGAAYRADFTNFRNVEVTACKYEDFDGDGGKDEPIEGWEVYLTIDGSIVDTQETGSDGCYTWEDLGPLPAGSYYDAEEETPDGWTPTSPTSVDFDSPPQSGASYRADFTNFRNVEVTVCKVKDADGNHLTTGDQTPKPGWEVSLTIDDEIVDTQYTGSDGCYTWDDLGPLEAGSYYDAHETPQAGWIVVGAYDNDGNFTAYSTDVVFGQPESGATYTAIFLNTPTQGCTPGFWQGGTDGGQAGGKWLWNEPSDPDWVASGGDPYNPYIWTTDFSGFFGGPNTPDEDMWYFVNPSMWSVNDDYHKAARSLTAAYLNASWGMAYAYTTSELQSMWTAAVNGGTLLQLHYTLDAANNAIGGCPISASLN